MIQVRVPATSANLGPGFDCLGLALSLYNFITVTAGSFAITLSGRYRDDIPADETNLVWQSMLSLWKEIDFPVPSVQLALETNIPPARGLGSSSAAIAGGLFAANALADYPLATEELIQLAARLEGHPDNITPAFLGGVTLAVTSAPNPTSSLPNRILARKLVAAPKLRAVALVPDAALQTKISRSVLPTLVSRQDAVFNIAHTALLVEAFLKEDYTLLAEATLDRLHQDQRAALIPGLNEAMLSAVDSGAYCAFLSGSGPTILALSAPDKAGEIAQAMRHSLASLGTSASTFVLDIDPNGVCQA